MIKPCPAKCLLEKILLRSGAEERRSNFLERRELGEIFFFYFERLWKGKFDLFHDKKHLVCKALQAK